MFWILLLLYLLFTKDSLATPNVNITASPVSIVSGDTFPVTFSIGNTNGVSYHYKIIAVDTSLDLRAEPSGCGTSYDQCPILGIAGTDPVTAVAYAKVGTYNGSFEVKIRIAQTDLHSKTYDSNTVTMNAIMPSITPSLTPTTIPSNSPTPTAPPSTNTPTSTPTNTPTMTPTRTPTPSLTKVPTKTITPSPEPTNTPEPTALLLPTPEISSSSEDISGINDIILPTSTPSLPFSFQSSSTLISILFVAFGGMLLLVPVFISKLKS